MAGLCDSFSRSLASSGARVSRKPSRLAWIQPGRSTTSTGAVAGGTGSPVTSTTYASARTAAARRSATTSAAPAAVTCGAGLTSFRAVLSATVQSTTEGVMVRGYSAPLSLPGVRPASGWADLANQSGSGGLAAATAEGGGHPVQPEAGRVVVGSVVDEERERQLGPVSRPQVARQRVHLGEGARLGTDDAATGEAAVVQKADAEAALHPGDGQPGEDRPQLRVLRAGGLAQQRDECCRR